MARPTTCDVDPNTPLLWAIREQVGLTGTKYGCGIAQCGACTVHIDGSPIRSCAVPAGAVAGRKITTIEGLAAGGTLTKVIGVRSEPYEYGSPEFVELEFFLMWRARGMKLETPAVRP